MKKQARDPKFRERLVKLRHALPALPGEYVPQKEVAKKAGISVSSYQATESGIIPGTAVLTKVARFFNVSEEYLLGKEEHPEAFGQESPYIKGAVIPIAQAQPAPEPEQQNLAGQFMEDINHLKVIYDYGDFEIINAIHSNLKTFNRTVQREIEVKELKQKVSYLEEENATQKTRIDRLEAAVEQLMAKQMATQENRKTGTHA